MIYDSPDCIQFCEDMTNAGFEIVRFKSRPAVAMLDYCDGVMLSRVTGVKLLCKRVGNGAIYYPASRSEKTDIAAAT